MEATNTVFSMLKCRCVWAGMFVCCLGCAMGLGIGQIISICGNYGINFAAPFTCHAREKMRRCPHQPNLLLVNLYSSYLMSSALPATRFWEVCVFSCYHMVMIGIIHVSDLSGRSSCRRLSACRRGSMTASSTSSACEGPSL